MNIKNTITRTFFLVLFTVITFSGNGQQLAFPGADGYGKYVTGGRGGAVYEVTNLKDDGLPGSLRYAINQSGTRTIVFRVSGTIILNSNIKITQGNITIAGQTAPGDGICIANHNVGISASNVIIRYIRFRLGSWDSNGNGADALSGTSPKLSGGSGSLPIKNILIDHCSISYGTDETLSIYDIENLTVQWCIISEAFNRDGHGFGGIWGGWGASFHHNMFAHMKSRSPRFCGARYQGKLDKEINDFRNNVIYNSGKTYGGEGGNYNIVNNYYRSGGSAFCYPSAPNPEEKGFKSLPIESIISNWYVHGNIVHGNNAVSANNWNGGVSVSSTTNNLKRENPLPSEYIGKEESAEEAYKNVCRGVGAVLPKRDSVDTRVVNDVINGTGKVPSTLEDIPGNPFPVLNSVAAPTDSDHDGMPDDWEITNGLNKDDASDRNSVGADGYTMLEKYLNGIEFKNMVEGIELKATNNDYIKITWSDNFLSEDGYIIERAIPGKAFSVVSSVQANISSYIDSSANATEEYKYRIKAYNATNESSYSVEASYVPGYYKLSVTIVGHGTVSPNDSSFLAGTDTEITLTATADTGWKFNKWSGGLTGSVNPKTLLMNSDKSITATFIEDKTGINEKFKSGISLYPNPVSGNLVIKTNHDFSNDAVIELLDSMGKLIFTQKVKESETILKTESLMPGIYLVKVTNLNNESIIKQFVKK